MGNLDGRLILLGVTGSIAAYKSAELARALTAAGADVQVLMTHTAQQFIGPLTLQTLTRRRPMTDPLELLPDQRIAHIVAADSADLILVAPATAHWLASMAAGLAGDVITVTCLASSAPVVVAPAMDGDMYAHPATRANVEKLRRRGATRSSSRSSGRSHRAQVGPGQAGGAGGQSSQRSIGRSKGSQSDSPIARMRPPVVDSGADRGHGGLARRRDRRRHCGADRPGALHRQPIDRQDGRRDRRGGAGSWRGRDADPRHESRRAAGRGGAGLARPAPREMRAAVLDAVADADALVMAAAVADFRPRDIADRQDRARRRRADARARAHVATSLPRPCGSPRATAPSRRSMVGFAAETGSLDRAREKADAQGRGSARGQRRGRGGSGFGTDTNRVTLVVPGGPDDEWPLMTKRQVADRLLGSGGRPSGRRRGRRIAAVQNWRHS